MKLIFEEKIESLDLDGLEFRKDYDLGHFLFELMEFNFKVYEINKNATVHEIDEIVSKLCKKAFAVSETFLFLLWEQLNILTRDPHNTLPFCNNFNMELKAFKWYFDSKSSIKDLTENETTTFIEIFNKILDRADAVQESLKYACDICLDMDNDEYDFSGLTSDHRWHIMIKNSEYNDPMWIIGQMGGEISEETIITSKGDTIFSESFFHSDGDELDSYYDDEDMDTTIKKYRNAIIEVLKVYRFGDFFSLCYAEFWHMIISNIKIRECRYCRKYFVPLYENTEYCNRIIPDKNKTCKEYGPMYFYRNKGIYDKLLGIYMKADQAHYKRHTRNKDYYTWEHLTTWREKAKIRLEMAQRGELSAEEFKEIIKPPHIN